MSDASGAAAGAQEPPEPSLVIPRGGEAAFEALMDVLAPEPDEQGVQSGRATAGAPAAGDGPAAAPVQGAAGAQAQPAAPAGGDAGGDGVQAGAAGAAEAGAAAGADAAGAEAGAAAGADGAEAAGAAGAAEGGGEAGTGVGTRDAAELEANWGAVSTALEQRQTQSLQRAALIEVRKDYGTYFEALEKHPRELIGQKVPKLDGSDGFDTLRDTADAQSWQEAVKVQLKREVDARASRQADTVRPMMNTLAASIKLFQTNADLVPNTKQFDPELAARVTDIAKAFELRVEGKLVGWSVDMQPLVEQERVKLKAARDAAAAAAGGQQQQAAGGQQPTAAQQRAAEQARNDAGQFSGPQAGIQSKAGASADGQEDFSTLFGTLGLPDFRI